MSIEKEYTNGEVTIVWKPKSCIHSTICVGGLPDVFRPNEKPWINIDAASTEALVEQVKKCPSGALGYYMNAKGKKEASPNAAVRAQVTKNGPLLVHGDITVENEVGESTTKNNVTAFCRCGASANKPYCDGTHAKVRFEG